MDTITITIRQLDHNPQAAQPYRYSSLTIRNEQMTSVTSLDTGALLRWVFRQFNAVDGSELMSLLGMRMPSLSVGDEVIITGVPDRYLRFVCKPFGWEAVP
jgi:hypothetical protein